MLNQCAVYITAGVFIPLSYVGFIYAFDDHRQLRDQNVRRRFLAALLNNLASITLTVFLLEWECDDPLLQMGFRTAALGPALVFPTALTLIFYTGTLVMRALDGSLRRIFALRAWKESFKDILHVRHLIIAPITEELAFRGCSATLLRHCLGTVLATFVAPITFSISHIHHINEDRKQGLTLMDSCINRSFQMLYTYLFGLYATHLFFRTGHIIVPIICHSLCNLFGIPAIDEVSAYRPKWFRALLYILHVGGFVGWYFALPLFLCPDLYQI